MPNFVQIDPTGKLPAIAVEVDVTNLPTNPTRVWTPLTNMVRSIATTSSGRNDEFMRTNAGTLKLVLDNRGNKATGLGLAKAQWVRVLGQYGGVTFPLWQGNIESIPRQWPSAGRDAIINLAASDILKLLRLYDLEGVTFPRQRVDQRIASIVGLAGLTTGSIDTDTDTCDAVTTALGQGSDALSAALDLELSENGLLIAGPTGTLSFQGRHWRVTNAATPLGTFADWGGGIPYADTVEYDDDDSRLANVVNVTPFGASAPITLSDAASKAKYFARENQSIDRTLQSSSTSLATSCAQYLLGRYKDPPPRLPALVVDLAAAAKASPSFVPLLLGAACSQRFTWNRAAATAISADVYVEQVKHTISLNPGPSWKVELQLTPATTEDLWVLGRSTLGVSTILAY